MLYLECPSEIEAPKRYRNDYGQLLEHSPYSQRDIRLPDEVQARTEAGFHLKGKTVSFVGYVLDARHSNVDKDNPLTAGNGESVQCNLLGCAYNDIHITLAEDPHEAKMCNTIVGEIVPHYRPPAWDLFDSPDYVSFFKTHPVKIIGQLFFDGSHVPCTAEGKAGNNPARDNAKDFERLALWEIHPIYAIDVCKFTSKSKCDPANQSAWLPFSQLKTRLGLTAVKPTDKCQANTDDPNSKCPDSPCRPSRQPFTGVVASCLWSGWEIRFPGAVDRLRRCALNLHADAIQFADKESRCSLREIVSRFDS